ncbi:thioredoxin domain-containing protein [Parasphingorhabdus sp.]|uniref:thioredoxin domain-containing protein n=1 Tax=Parasphingorhabdus sp. TaxID=2709688 RepID=UPI003296C24A
MAKPAKKLDRRSLIQLAGVSVVGLAAATILRNSRSVGENVGDNATVREIRADNQSPRKLVAGADVTIVSFNDFNCTACRKAHPALQQAVEEDGRCNMVYRDWPIFGPASERAGRIALASDYQGIYPAVYDILMRRAGLSDRQLRMAVEQSGGTWDRLLRDLKTHHKDIESQLDTNSLQAFALNVKGTPAFLIGPILVRGAVSSRDFAKVISVARDANSL